MPRPALIASLLIPVLVLGGLAWSGGGDVWIGVITWMMEQQRQFHRDLADALRGVGGPDPFAAAWALSLVSLLYGVFHAAGPGHGKAVIATYLLSQESQLWRGLRLAVAASVVQGVVAIVLIYGLVYLAHWLPRDARSSVAWSERVSFVLLCAVGLTLMVRSLRALMRTWRLPEGARQLGSSSCAGDGCAHVLVPTQRQMSRASGWRGSVAVILSIGLRPCTGAVLVLALASGLGMPWAGVVAVLVMSMGTAGTVSVLAVLTVSARKWAFFLLRSRVRGVELSAWLVAAVGGGLIAAMAVSLLTGSFDPIHPLL